MEHRDRIKANDTALQLRYDASPYGIGRIWKPVTFFLGAQIIVAMLYHLTERPDVGFFFSPVHKVVSEHRDEEPSDLAGLSLGTIC